MQHANALNALAMWHFLSTLQGDIMTQEQTSILNDLIETRKDAESGFKTCAEHVSSPDLKRTLEGYSRQSHLAALDLQQRVRFLGGEPEESGTVAGAMHRGWIDIKALVTGQDDVAILNECERGEDSAMKSFRNALSKDLSVENRQFIERQFSEVQREHLEIKALRDRYRARDNAMS